MQCHFCVNLLVSVFGHTVHWNVLLPDIQHSPFTCGAECFCILFFCFLFAVQTLPKSTVTCSTGFQKYLQTALLMIMYNTFTECVHSLLTMYGTFKDIHTTPYWSSRENWQWHVCLTGLPQDENWHHVCVTGLPQDDQTVNTHFKTSDLCKPLLKSNLQNQSTCKTFTDSVHSITNQ